MTPLIDDDTATRYWSERDTAPEAERESRNAALIDWAKAKKADQFRAEQQQAESAYTDLEGWWKENGAGHVFEKDEDRLEVANRRFIANQFQQTPDQQGRYYPTYRDEYLQKTFGKSGLSETDTFNLIRDSLTARKATEDALRELPGALAKGMFSKVAEGKTLDETDSWFLFQDWKDRHADKLGKLPEGWESAMLDRAVKLQARSETMMRDLAPESKRAFDTLMAFTRPEDAEALPEAGRADVENIAKEFAKLTPEDRQNIYSTLYYAAEADGAGMGKGFFEKVGEGIARGGVNIYNDAEMTAQDRQARQNISEFQSLLDRPEQQPGRMQTAQSIQMQRDMAQRGVEENTQRLSELKALREIRQIADGTIDPIKTEMDGVMGEIVQGAYDYAPSVAYMGLAAVPVVGFPATMGAMTNSNYLRMLDAYPDMDADAALGISAAVSAPMAFIERLQGRALIGKSPKFNALMKKMTDVRIPIAGRLAIGYGANVGVQTVQEWAQEAMPVAADQLAAAIREDMPEFDAEKAWGAYREQMPDIFYSMLWGGLIGTGASTFREFKRNGQFERSLGELEMQGVTGEAAQDIAAEQDLDVANAKFQEAWGKRTPEDIQAGIAKRAAQLETARSTQQNPELPVRRIEENADGTLTHIIEKPDGTVLYRTNDSDAADTAFVNITGMVGRSQLTGTTRGIVESLQFIDQVNQAAGRGEDVQKLLLDDAPRNLLDEYEANPTEQNLNNLFETVRSQGQDINEPAELANFPVLASNQGALVDGVFRSIIKIQDGATGDKVMRDFSQDNLKRAIAENRITMDWVRENLNQVIPLIESERNTGPALRTETDTDVIESFSDVAVAYMTGRIREEQIPQGFRGFLRRMAIIVKDIFRRAYRLKRAIAEGKVDSNFEGFLAESVGLNQQTMVDTTRERVGGELAQGTFNYSVGQRVLTDTNPFKGWFGEWDVDPTTASKVVDPDGKPMVVYHGTQRADRVGDRFRKSRATSGPMAFFTNDPAIASSYSTNKRDTSAEMPSDYAEWFKYKGKGMRSPVAIDRAWWSLSPEERAAVNERIYTIGYADWDAGDGPIVANSQSIMPSDSIDYELRQARGNGLRALVEMWLSSGSLFNQEERFLEVLQAAGVKGATLDDPNAARSAVYPVYLSIKNPLDTASIPGDVVSALEHAGKRKRAKQSAGGNPDAWDKNTISGNDWMASLKEDMAKGTTHAWTRIPDWVTETLSSLGYDGIKDTGGKHGGVQHQVWIPFNETQVKSATGNRGTFDPTSANINYSIGKKNADKTNVSNFLNQVRTQPRGGKPISLEIGKLDGVVLQNLPEGFQGVSGFPIKIDEDLIRKNDNLSKQKKSLQDLRIQIPTDEDYQLLSEFINSADRVAVGKPRKDGTTTLEFRNSENPKVAATAVRTKAGYLAVVRFVGEEVALPLTEPNEGRLELTSETAGQNQSATTPGKVNFSIGIARNAISQVSKKDDASRVGTAKLGTSKVPKNTPQDSNVSGDNVPDDLLAKQMEKMNYAHLPKNILSEKNPKKKRRKLINWFKKNLLALHDAFPEEFRARATHWYDGANRIAKEMGSQFQASVEQASGVIAVFSPQKDWFMNVAQAEQFMELWTNSQDVVLEESLVRAEIEGIIEAATVSDKQKRKKVDGETKEQTAERREYNKALDKLEKEKRRKIVEQVIGKTIRQLDATPTLQGWGIRVLAQVTFGRNYRNLSPEGDRLGMATNDDGALSKNGWGSTNEIEKAVRIMKDGSLKNISDNLGNEHKVRNFYNNIAAPNTPYGDATIDTHAVAAAHLMPYGAKATEVGHNFGSGMNGSEVLGISGVYHLYLDAYREAAADRGILPRQMQSITWEAIRLVYPAATKNAATLAKSQKTWKDLTDDSARNTLVGGRIPSPVWAGANDNRESQALSGGLQEDGSGDVSGGGLLSGVRPTGAGRDGGVNYSIASQSEIDRVNRALGGMNRGPDERLKVYERAKQKFSKLMAWNSDELGAMADTGSDETQIRRTQLLQGLGELDAILQVLPPEVRGRVGGYTKLANIAPMDVFKDGVKVSEAKNMTGAIISAWMKEGQNIGQAGKQVSLPPGYTAKENLATARADKALADFFRDRIKKIDTELEKVLVREYTEAITKAVMQSRPKAGDNGVRKSTLGAETQKFADMVQRATLLDDEATPKRMAEIEAALANPDATAEDISALSEEWSILNTFGDLDNRSSETLAQGLDWLKGQLQMGREAWRIKEQARIDEQRARAAATIEWLGKSTAKKRFADKGLMQRIAEVGNNYLLDHASFEQFVTAMLPPEIAANFSERLRKADMAAQSSEIRDGKGILDAVREGAKAANMSAGDAMLWLKGDQKNAVAYLEGRKVKDERIAIELAQKIVTGEADRSKLTDADIETLRNELATLPADTQKEFVTIKRVIFRGEDVKLDMSRAKAIQLLLSWNQPDVQIKMRKEGWTDESATDLKALVNDPVSRSVVSYLQSLYGKGAGIVNPVYSRMFGMTMPQVKNYAPTRFLNAKDSKDIGLDGSPTATGTTPGFAKTRVTHSAKIAPEDALTVAQGHIAQQAHWVHFAELAREFRALLSSPEVRESLKQKHGDAVLKSAELWADQLEQRGGNKARESAWLNPILGTVLSGKAVSSLGFSLKTLAMQLDNTIRFGLALDMRQIVSALSNPSTIVEDIQTVWESDAIQNRLQGGATAEARFLFSRYAGKPNFGAKIAEASMTPINWLDSAATSISSAIVYRANLNDALAAGMPENLAKQAALDAASQAIYRFAQPVSFGQKSIMENNGNVLAKTFFLFMSDPRLKTAILADAARGLATGQGNANEHIRRILVVETMAVLSHVVASAFRDAFSDDDDEEIWNLGGFAKAILLAPLQGFFFAGTVGELAISKLTGQKTFNSSTQNPLLSAMEQAVRAGNNLDDVFNLDDPDAMLKEWNNIFRSMALAPWLAAPAVLLNMVKPALGLYQNATTED
jgi:hypothetical protein